MLILNLLITFAASADSNQPTPTFSIVEETSSVIGKPSYSPNEARANWDVACDQWKAEIKGLNKSDQLIMISCDTPSCTSDEAQIECTSIGKFKLKTSGIYSPSQEPTVIQTTAPQPVIYQTVQAPPRPGFIWISGYWGWHGHRHFWFPGRWEARDPIRHWRR